MAVAPTKTEGVSAFVLSESLEQLAASKAVKISRERVKKLPEDALFMGNKLTRRPPPHHGICRLSAFV